jgi:hypothetical protein
MVGAPTERVRILAEKCHDNFLDALRYQQPEKRDPTRVAAARLLLKNLHNEQEKARKLVEQAGPYRSPLYEPARKAAKDYLVAAEAATVALDACFVGGPKWRISGEPNERSETDEMRLQQLLNEALEADLRWRNLAVKIVKTYEPGKRFDSLNTVRREPPAAGPASNW